MVTLFSSQWACCLCHVFVLTRKIRIGICSGRTTLTRRRGKVREGREDWDRDVSAVLPRS